MKRLESKDLVKPLEEIASKGYDISMVFSDFVSLSLYALMRNDDLYLEVMGKYRNKDKKGKREADHFAEAFSLMLQFTNQEQHDVLGDVYMEISSKWKVSGMGQFFTPVNLCEAKAQMMIGDDEGNEPRNVSDPASGSGRTLISAAKLLHPDSYFQAIDLDPTCSRMCALNFVMFNMNGHVIQGNTLSMELYDGYLTKRTGLGGVVRRMEEEEIQEAVNFSA